MNVVVGKFKVVIVMNETARKRKSIGVAFRATIEGVRLIFDE